jgi:hypothetical protein
VFIDSSLLGFAAMNAKTIAWSMLLIFLFVLGAFRVFRTPRAVNAAEEQAVIATIKLNSGDMGSTEERQRVTALEDQLSDAIKRSSTGEFDGDEYGGGVCTVYMYGPSAERLFAAVLPILKKFRAPKGSYVVKRYGKPGAKQDRISLGDE